MMPLERSSQTGAFASSSSQLASMAKLESLTVLDFFSTFDEVPNSKNANIFIAHKHVLGGTFKYWMMLGCVGILTALISFGMDYFNESITFPLRHYLLETRHPLLFSGALSILFGTIGAFSCHVISSQAIGSGIPQVKAILSGVMLPNFLSFYTLIAKVVGLLASIAAGLHVGKEGPFVHISTIIANMITKIKYFRKFVDSPTGKLMLISVAVAAGVTATFGTPLGGVLFSIEVTATFFMVHSLWKAYICCAFCSITFTALRFNSIIKPFDPTDLPRWDFSLDIVAFVVLGAVCGSLGGFFVHLTSFLWQASRRLLANPPLRYLYTCTIALVLTLLATAFPYMANEDRQHIDRLFSLEDLDDDLWGGNATYGIVFFALSKIIATSLSLSCPVPCGIVSPILVLGASIGRMYGMLLAHLIRVTTYPAAFAIAGAAGLVAGVTRTISITVIVYELTGQMSFMLPVLVTVLVAYSVNSMMSTSYYDIILRLQQLPYLPAIRPECDYNATAGDLKFPADLFTLSMEGSTLFDLLVCRLTCHGNLLPIVDQQQKLRGAINVAVVDAYLSKFTLTEYKDETPPWREMMMSTPQISRKVSAFWRHVKYGESNNGEEIVGINDAIVDDDGDDAGGGDVWGDRNGVFRGIRRMRLAPKMRSVGIKGQRGKKHYMRSVRRNGKNSRLEAPCDSGAEFPSDQFSTSDSDSIALETYGSNRRSQRSYKETSIGQNEPTMGDDVIQVRRGNFKNGNSNSEDEGSSKNESDSNCTGPQQASPNSRTSSTKLKPCHQVNLDKNSVAKKSSGANVNKPVGPFDGFDGSAESLSRVAFCGKDCNYRNDHNFDDVADVADDLFQVSVCESRKRTTSGENLKSLDLLSDEICFDNHSTSPLSHTASHQVDNSPSSRSYVPSKAPRSNQHKKNEIFIKTKTSKNGRQRSKRKSEKNRSSDTCRGTTCRGRPRDAHTFLPYSDQVDNEAVELADCALSCSYGDNGSGNSNMRKTRGSMQCCDRVPVAKFRLRCHIWRQASKYDIQVLEDTTLNLSSIDVDWSPLQVVPSTPFHKLHYLFTMLFLGQLFVCESDSTLTGVLTRESFDRNAQKIRRGQPNVSYQKLKDALRMEIEEA